MVAGGIDLDVATRLSLAAADHGRDPVALARKYVKLRHTLQAEEQT